MIAAIAELTEVNAVDGVLFDDVMVPKEHRRLRRERRTVRTMIGMYCAAHHGAGGLCGECVQLADYADRRLDLCPYGAEKPSCTNCPIHCYRPEPREAMRAVMRFAGPRMLLSHPYLAVRHLMDDRKKASEVSRKAAAGKNETLD